MNEHHDETVIAVMLRQLPKATIPADLVAAIEAATLLRKRWWETEVFRLRWMPALVGLTTALGALWLSHIQRHPERVLQSPIPVAARPAPRPEMIHAFLPQTETSNQEKGDSRENPKS